MLRDAAAWRRTCFIAGSIFILSAGTVWILGVPAWEERLYHAVRGAFDHDGAFFSFTRLGSKAVLLPAAVLLLALLPQTLLRRWWLWVAVNILVAMLEGLAKEAIGRPRPEELRPGFPSGHTAAAAAFWITGGYCVARLTTNR